MDFDPNEDTLDVVFEYVPGKSVESRIKSSAPNLGWKRMLNVALDTASAIMELHTQDREVYHGDLKPSNIILTNTGGAKVTDWYFSSLVEQEDMIDMMKISNPLYLAPEILDDSNHSFSKETDVYAFGMCLLVVRAVNDHSCPSDL